jgi:YHS domain-containing protein
MKMNLHNRHLIMLFLVSTLMLTIISLAGCKKKSEPAGPKGTKAPTTIAIEQKTCPVMGGAINKDIFTEYKGKKVYFCCAPCADKFKANPQEYTAKLPQFKD